MKTRVEVGDRIRISGLLYRILIYHKGFYLLIEMESTKLKFRWENETVLNAFLDRGEAEIPEDEEEPYHSEKLDDAARSKLKLICSEIEKILIAYYPEWDILASKKTKPEIKALERKLSCSVSTFMRYMLRYLQSGRNEYSLMDRRLMNPGTKVTARLRGPKPKYYNGTNRMEDLGERNRIFEEFYNDFLSNNEKTSVIELYDRMISHYFSDTLQVPPTYRQMLGYINRRLMEDKHMTLSQAKMNARNLRNNGRLLKGNSQTGIFFPGQMLEIDEVEIDCYAVAATDRSQIVGKPVMYCAVDVYSSCIVACSMAFENNSILGVTNLFFTLLDEHTDEAKRYGVDTDPGIFPSRFIPTAIRTDQGAEYTSGEFERMCRELGINHNLVAPGTGSLKGLVEQFFHQFQTLMKSPVKDAGETYRKHNSNHFKKAALTVDECRAVMYNFVNYFNRHIRKDYPYTKEMLEMGIGQYPAAIWQYGIENIQSPRRITDETMDGIFFKLLRNDIRWTLSRKGITYKRLIYWDESDWIINKVVAMSRAGKNSEKLSGIRYDPRLVDYIYRMENGKLIRIGLSELRDEQETFKGMTWDEYLKLYSKRLEDAAGYMQKDGELRRQAKENVEKIVDDARTVKKLNGDIRNSRTGVREARKAETMRLRKTDAYIGIMNHPGAEDIYEHEDLQADSEGHDNETPISADVSMSELMEELKTMNEKLAYGGEI